MDIIGSSDNSLIKTVVKLKQRKYRYEYGKFVLEGYRLIKDTLSGSAVQFAKVIVAQSRYRSYYDEFDDISVVSDSLFEKISDTVNSQGIMAIVSLPEFKKKPDDKYCLYLDEVRDPGNLGTIIRTSVACGFHDIILNNCVDVFNPKTIRSSMSTFIGCNFIEATDDIFSDGCYRIICADAKGVDIRTIASELKDEPLCVVIGNEARGVSEKMKAKADFTVSLPMEHGVESLNAAVSASVLMYYLKYFS